MEKYMVGIDLGTTNSVCCFIKNGKFEFLKFKGEEMLSSVIIWKDEKVIVGESARKKSVIYAENFIKSSKTYMGDNSKVWELDGRIFTPTDVATEILTAIRLQLEKHFNTEEQITAVITVPAYFTSSQIKETDTAGQRAGFNVKQIITEPVAAAVAYGFEEEVDNTIFVVDIGGGTFDVSILKSEGRTFQTIAIDGDNRLGGDDFDNIILEMCLARIRQTLGVDLSTFEKSGLSRQDYSQSKQKLIVQSEKKKIELSDMDSVDIEIANLLTYKGIQYNFVLSITREQFEEDSKALLVKIKRTIKKCLDDKEISPDEIDKIILVGGTSNMPIMQDYIKALFNKQPYSDKDLSKLVAMGAALIADSEENTITVIDIISHSLGIEVTGEKFNKILLRDEKFPLTKSKEFTTTINYQKEVMISVFEGENESYIEENDFYGSFLLKNIENALAGVPQIEVTFSFDKSRNLQVTASDLKTGSKIVENIKIDMGIRREKPKPQAYDIALLLDNSGSMSGNSMELAKDACRELVTSMIDLTCNQIALISFESISRILSELTHSQQQLINAIDSLYATGSTDMTAAINNAGKVLYESSNTKIAILVTDGYPDSQDTTNKRALEIKNNGIRLVTIGVGGGVDSNYLKSLASSSVDYYYVDDMKNLRNAFKTIVSGLKSV